MRLGQSRFPTLQSACFYFELWISDHTRHSKLRGNEEPGKRQNKSAGIRGWPADVIGCSFASDWLRGWYEFSGPIKGRSKIKQSSPRSPSTQNSLSHPLSFFSLFFKETIVSLMHQLKCWPEAVLCLNTCTLWTAPEWLIWLLRH